MKHLPKPCSRDTLTDRDARLDAALETIREVGEIAHVGGWSYRPGDPGPVWDAMAREIHEVSADYAPTLDQALAFYPEETRAVVGDALAACLDEGRAFDIEAPFVTATGRDAHIRAAGRPIVEDGRIVGVRGVIQDVTERHARDAAVARLQARFEAIVANTPVAISLRDRLGTLHLANRHYEALVGRGDLAGLTEGDLLPEHVADALQDRDAAVLRGGGSLISEDVYPGADGGEKTLLTSRFLIHDTVLGEKVVCAIGADITDQKRLQEELEAARGKAEAATRAKADFLSAVSHELRTPMNGVLGMAEKLSHTELDPEQRAALDVIRDSGALLVALVNDLLDFAKVERGAMQLEAIPFDPAETARRVIPSHEAKAAARHVALDLEIDPAARTPRIGDPLRLQQILHNLVGNAVKFTHDGRIAVRIDAAPDGSLRVAVRDSGIGMTPDQAACVFDSFAQADETIARRYGGTGLGLSIVKGLAEAMGGSVALETAPGAGSTFTVALPLPLASDEEVEAALRPPTAPADDQGAQDLSTLRVLAADDNEINRAVLSAFLAQLGVRATMADGGEAAVEAAQSAPFDLILLDVVMPGVDGPTALGRIVADARAAGRTPPPAVAVTGQASGAQIEACLAAGFAGHLAKPIDGEKLRAMLSRFAASRRDG